MAYVLGARSQSRLKGVDPRLVRVVERAIQLTTQDFVVQEGLRSVARQRQLVAAGASRTMNSKHITGHAVDLVPYAGGQPRWEWPLIYPIARAVIQASKELGVEIRWGGIWDREIDQLDPNNLEAEIRAYCQRHNGPDFLDGPHYELKL